MDEGAHALHVLLVRLQRRFPGLNEDARATERPALAAIRPALHVFHAWALMAWAERGHSWAASFPATTQALEVGQDGCGLEADRAEYLHRGQEATQS
jgi:hypothetical protein